MKLFLIVLGGRPPCANIEQHDIVFAVGESVKDAHPVIRRHWPDANPHIDSYAVIDEVDGYRVSISEGAKVDNDGVKLFFINLGGYRPGDLEEYHKKFVIPARNMEEAKQVFKVDPFYADGLGNPKARSHLDDKIEVVGFDMDDTLVVDEHIEPEHSIRLEASNDARFAHNEIIVGYKTLPPLPKE